MKQYTVISIFSLILSSCSTIDSSRIAPGYVEAYNSISNLILGFEDNTLTPELISNITYASSIINIGNGPKGLVILESKNKEGNTWVSADGIYLLEKSGKIIRTKGFTNNLSGFLSSVNFSDLLNVDTDRNFTYYISFSSPDLYNLKLTSTFTVKEKKLVKLFNKSLYLTLIEEDVNSEQLGWRTKNLYWVDDNSFIWKTEQTISPRIPKIYMEVTKKPS